VKMWLVTKKPKFSIQTIDFAKAFPKKKHDSVFRFLGKNKSYKKFDATNMMHITVNILKRICIVSIFVV